jgi:purine-nucleoside phosphorylase
MTSLKSVRNSAKFIKKQTGINSFDLAVILGSGLGNSIDKSNGQVIPYNKIPNFPIPTVFGHSDNLIIKRINNKNVLFFLGRTHYYEGYTPGEVVFSIRLIKELDAKNIILTNSCGSLRKKFKIGDLVLIKDHINLTGTNPLIGQNIDEHGKRFPDMSKAYSSNLIKIFKKSLKKRFKTGVYVGVSGPTYETHAEAKFYKKIGGDLVGMSTVMENIVANQCAIETMGISCVTNYLFSKAFFDHNDVIKTANKSNKLLIESIMRFIEVL